MREFITKPFVDPSIGSATLIGQLSLIIWSITATFAAALINIPTFEILFVISVIGFFSSSAINTISGRWGNISNHPKYIWVIGILGIFGNDVFYILSFKHAPVVQASLINYLWPILVILCSGIFLRERLQTNHLIASIIAFLGIYILLTSNADEIGFQFKYISGYIYAFMAAILWTFYVILSRRYGKATPEMFAVYSFFGSFIALFMHLRYETFVIPSTSEIIAMSLMGIFSHSIAYFSWDFGIKKGNFRLLGILSYTCPIMSVFILITTGFAELTIPVIIATLFVTFASIVGGLNFSDKKADSH